MGIFFNILSWNKYHTPLLQIFNGNHDSDTPVTHYFSSPVRARYVRINPQTWQEKIAMRFEISGCPVLYPSQYWSNYISCEIKQLLITVLVSVEKTTPLFSLGRDFVILPSEILGSTVGIIQALKFKGTCINFQTSLYNSWIKLCPLLTVL